MKNVNFIGSKFKKIEDEELKEKKKREQNLNLKRKLLKDEFTEIDELEKHTAKQQEIIYSIKGSTDVEFKKELDRQIEHRTNQQKQLEELERKLKHLNDSDQPNHSVFEQNFSSRNDNAFATKSNYSARQFSTIFSKSYYRSNTLNFLSQTQMSNRQEIEEHLERVQKEIETTDSNIVNEDERTLSIKNQLEQLFKTKQKIKQALGEIENLTEAADRRFDNLQRIQFLAQEKQTTTFKQLNKIKSELNDQDLMRSNILSRQEEQRDKEHLGCKENQEITGNILIKIDELQSQYNSTKQELQSTLAQERKIIKKRMQSKYILKYIDFFDKFREIFLGDEVEEDTIKMLYDAQDESSQNEIQHLDEIVKENNIDADARSNFSANSNMQTPRGYNENEISSSSRRHPLSPSKNNKDKDIIKEGDLKLEENQSQSDQDTKIIYKKVERTELITKINDFLDLYPSGLDSCVEQIFRLFDEMRYCQETNNERYEQLLKAKTQKTQDLLILENDLEELMDNNQYIEAMKNNRTEELKQENIQEALDAGYVKVIRPRYPLVAVSKDGEDLANKLSLYSTVNILKLSDATDFSPIVEEIKCNKNFFFNFFMNYGDSIIRICKIVKTIFKKILQNTPSPQMNKRCSETIKYIQSIWMDNQKNREVVESVGNFPDLNQQQEKQSYSGTNQLGAVLPPQIRNKSRLSIDNGVGFDLELQHSQEKAIKKQRKRTIIVEKFNLEEIKTVFFTIFGEQFEKEAEEFFQGIKNDRLVWFFCNIEIIEEFLLNKFNSNENNAEQAVDDVLMSIVELEDYASLEYNHKLNDLYNHFTGLMTQIKLENTEILEDLQSKNIIYHPNRIFKQNELQNNQKIQLAIENAIKRQNEYLFSQSDNASVKEDLSMYGNGANSPPATHHLLNNRNISSEDQQRLNNLSGQGSKDNSRLQQIVDYISSVPSSRQREAAKRKFIPQIQQHYSINSKALISQQNTSNMNHPNNSNQNISTSNRASTLGVKELLPQQFAHQNSNVQQQQQQLSLQQQHMQSSQQQNQHLNLASPLNQQLISPLNSMIHSQQQTVSTVQNTQSTQQIDGQQQRLSAINGILKKKPVAKKTLEYKSLGDIYEDNFIDEEAKKQKEREKQEYLEYLIKEKEKNKKLLQIEKEKVPNAQFKIIQNLNKRLTCATDTQNTHNKTLKQFSTNQKILSKIDRLDRNYDPAQASNAIFSDIREEKKNIYKSMVQQEQDELIGSEDDKPNRQRHDYNDEDDEEGENSPDNSNNNNNNNNNAKLQKSQSAYSYLRTTNSMEQRKKAIIETIRELESERLKNFNHQKSVDDKNVSLPQSQHEKLRQKGMSREKNPHSTMKSWKTSVSTATKRPDTQQQLSQNMNSQFYSSQNEKFFQKYKEMPDGKMPNIKEKEINKSVQNRVTQSSKSTSHLAKKNLKFLPQQQQMNQKNNSSNKSGQYNYRLPQTSEAKYKSEFKSQDYDKANFYDFPFFSHPMSVTNNQFNIPMYPFMTPPTLNLYTPTGLLTNIAKNDSINLANSQSHYY